LVGLLKLNFAMLEAVDIRISSWMCTSATMTTHGGDSKR